MQQKELLKQGDADAYVLALAAHVPDSETFIQELRQFKGIVLDWFKARGKTGKEVTLILVADESNAMAHMELLARIHQEEVDLDPVFRQATFNVTILAGGEHRLVQDFSLKPA